MRSNQAKRLVLVLFVSMGLVLKCDIRQSSITAQLAAQSVVLNGLIAKYQKSGTLSQSDQEKYVQNLRSFKQEVMQLQDEGQGVQEYQKSFVKPYMDWSKIMIADASLLTQLNMPEQSVAPAHADSVDQARTEKIANLYLRMYDEINDLQETMTSQIEEKLNSLGNYSPAAQTEFTQFLQNQMQSFTGSVKAIKTGINGDYFAFLEQHGQVPNAASQLDVQEHDFLQGVANIAQDAVLCVQALILDITSQAVKSQMVLELNSAFAASQTQAQKDYEEQLENNKKGLNRSWWEEVKLSGKDVLGSFSTEFKKELATQTQAAINKQGGKIVSAAGHSTISFVKNKISPALAEKLKGLSETLKLEKYSQFLSSTDGTKSVLKWFIRQQNDVAAPVLPVQVDTTPALSVQEKTFIRNRLPKVAKVLKEEFEIEEPLRIGFCCSGGGIRAMIGTMGIFTAAARSKILQATMYTAGLSGSTWMIAPWACAYLNYKIAKDYEQSLKQVRQNWATVLDNQDMILVPGAGTFTPAALTGQIASDFSHQVAVRIGYGQTLSAVDLYGGMVGNVVLDLMKANRLNVTWSSLATAAQRGEIPLPLCSAVFDAGLAQVKATGKHTQYEWFETGPFQAGSTVLGYIPIKYFGSVFKDGVLQTTDGQLRPEYPLSFFEGVYGSAFGLSFNDVIDKGLPVPKFNIGVTQVAIPVDEWMRNVIDDDLGAATRKKRPEKIHARFANFSVDVATSALNNKPEIGLFDGGINFNFPLPLLIDRSQRAVDLIFIYDSNPGDENAFIDATAYYKRKGIAIPNLSGVTKAYLVSKPMTIFNDPRAKAYNPEAATFIYFPTRKSMPVPTAQPFDGDATTVTTPKVFDISKMPYITPNFKYTPSQMGDLVDAMDFAFTSQLSEIKEVMKLVAKARHGSGTATPVASVAAA